MDMLDRFNRRCRSITPELVRKANKAAMDGKKYPPEIEAWASNMPKLSAKQINEMWARVNARRTEA